MLNWIDIRVAEEQRRDLLRAVEHRHSIKALSPHGNGLANRTRTLRTAWRKVVNTTLGKNRHIFTRSLLLAERKPRDV